ncbi:helix-turn-helix domain-containing protein [Methanomethylovorans hollandica]|uniref:helix-turn-helix domain-containing protein n=1 Tax=Methanomethylovorans hollandica TaxID=101192 RepID=UPI0009FC2F65|nr:helix-turn-helix domain-containing protein [Methanomethylovorans hollandica]
MFRIYPTKSQIRQIQRSLELCRQVYNRTLAERKQVYEEIGKTLSKYTLNNLLPQWKADLSKRGIFFRQVLRFL